MEVKLDKEVEGGRSCALSHEREHSGTGEVNDRREMSSAEFTSSRVINPLTYASTGDQHEAPKIRKGGRKGYGLGPEGANAFASHL